MGPWYRKVNERVRTAMDCRTVRDLVEVLGEPDKVDGGDETLTPTRLLEWLSARLRDGTRAEVLLTFVDPYRPRKRYKFEVIGDAIESGWIEVVDGSNQHVV